METTSQKSFDNKKIEIYEDGLDSWFNLKDIGNVLNIKQVRNSTRCMPTNHKKQVKVITNGGPQWTVFINKLGLYYLISKSRKTSQEKCKQLCDVLDIPFTATKVDTIETECLIKIMEVFDEIATTCREFIVDTYRIDLYFPELKIAVECDENGHNKYDSEAEMKREKFLKHQLNCDFIRFNPHEPKFSIFQVINKIFKLFVMRSNDHQDKIQYCN